MSIESNDIPSEVARFWGKLLPRKRMATDSEAERFLKEGHLRRSLVTLEEESEPSTISERRMGAFVRVNHEEDALTESTPMPPTLPSVKLEATADVGGGKKFDTGKTRTDLLPMGAIAAMAWEMKDLPESTSDVWETLLGDLRAWKRNESTAGARTIASIAACLCVLLTRELVGDVRVTSLLPTCGPALNEVAKVLTFGASKYGPNNWQGLENFTERYYAAMLRHIFAPEKKDSESGLFHLAHALTGALFLTSREVGHDPT